MAKSGEIGYLQNLAREHGEQAVRHAAGKPFSDIHCCEYLAEIGAILALLPPPPGQLLDLGCGTGWTSFFFAQRGFDVTGVDIAPDMIELAEDRRLREGQERLRFTTADYEEFDGECTFDCVVFYDSLHHAMDEFAALRCAFRALKPGGICIASEPGGRHHRSQVAVEAARKFNVTEKAMSPAKVVRLGRRAGFRDFRVYPHAFRIQREVFPRPHVVSPAPGATAVRALRLAARMLTGPALLLYRAARLSAWSEIGRWVNGITVLVK